MGYQYLLVYGDTVSWITKNNAIWIVFIKIKKDLETFLWGCKFMGKGNL
jgi:hypothetical protein